MQTTYDPVMLDTPEPPDTLRTLYQQMVLVRRFEEKAEEMYKKAYIGGYCHLNIGEEAAYVGVMSALRPIDYVFASYKDHGVALLSGSTPGAVMAELFGRETGVAKGRGGSMHMINTKAGFMGGYGIVGGQLPLAVGAALALDYEGREGVVACLFGDGAVNIGAFHESLNLAKVWNLPVVFVAVNNQYGMGTSVDEASAEPELYRRAAAYRIPAERVDGNDILAVRRATARMARMAQSERLPGMLELMTYRYRGHSIADPGKVYRTNEEIDAWKKRDPIIAFRERLIRDAVLTSDDATAIDAQIDRDVDEATQFAMTSPDPDPATLFEHVYGEAYSEQAARMWPGAPFGDPLARGKGVE